LSLIVQTELTYDTLELRDHFLAVTESLVRVDATWRKFASNLQQKFISFEQENFNETCSIVLWKLLEAVLRIASQFFTTLD
jgi:hypothetical protein